MVVWVGTPALHTLPNGGPDGGPIGDQSQGLHLNWDLYQCMKLSSPVPAGPYLQHNLHQWSKGAGEV